MLSRAVLRSVRTTALRPTSLSPNILSNQWSRAYAKDHKSKQKKPLTFLNSAGPIKPTVESAKSPEPSKAESSAASSKGDQGSNDFSEKQSEFQTTASPSKNTTPKPTEPTPSKKNDTPAPDYSKEQTEFKTSASPDENTAPQSTSPSAADPAEAQKEEYALPDIRQGIPSTIDFELSQAAARSRGGKGSILKLADDPTAEGGGMGDMPASSYVSSADRRRERLTNWFALAAVGAILISPVYLGRNWETEEEEKAHPDAPSGFSVGKFFARIKARADDWMGYYTEPAFPKLLPDITDPAMAHQYTLVLNLEDLLIHNEWTREHGWRLAKRPGLDYFIRYLQQYYELVIWTTQPFSIAEVVLEKLDPYRLCQPLFREATVYHKGEHIKDLSYLNRDLSKVIVLDTNPRSVQRQPENAIILKKFEGDPHDKELVRLIPFLEYIPALQTKDVREVIKAFEGSDDIATEYAKRLAVQRQKFEARLAEERKKHPKSALSWGTRALGIKPMPQYEGDITFAEALQQGKMIQDIYRERGQREYERFDKLIRTEGPKWLAEEKAMQKKMQEEMMKNMNPLTKLGLAPPEESSGSASSPQAK